MNTKMSFCLASLIAILVPTVMTINATNSAYHQEINDMKRDLKMLRNLVTSLNTSLLFVQSDKDEKVKEMKATIQNQQQEMRSMNTTIQIQHLEMRSMNVTIQAQHRQIQAQQRDIILINTTIYAEQQIERSMNATIQGQQREMINMNTSIKAQNLEMRSMNGRIQAQQQHERSMNTTMFAQQQEIRSLNTAIHAQQQIDRSMNATIQTQQQEISYLIGTLQDAQQKITLIRNNSAQIQEQKEVNEKGKKNYDAVQLIVQDLVTSVNTLRNTSQVQLSHMNDDITSVTRQVHYTSLSFLDVQKKLTTFENSNKETNKSIALILRNQQSKWYEINNLRSETKSNFSFVSNKLKTLDQEMHSLLSEVNRTIAFTVSTSSYLRNYIRKTIIYDKVITNKGGAYNSKTGVFTCPVPGTYVFTWSTMSGSASEYCITYIYHNGNRLLESYSYEGNGGSHEAGSNTIVLALTAGDRVWIQTENGLVCFGYPYTGFSGWKL